MTAGAAQAPFPGSESAAQGTGAAAQQSQAALEAYEMDMADYAIYNLMRMCANATRALAMYECRTCLFELEKLPPVHKRSAWTMAMVGKAHYELGEYSAVSTVDSYLTSLRVNATFTGRTCLRGRQSPGTLPALGHGGLLDSPLAPAATDQIVLPCSGAAGDKPSVTRSVDSSRKLLFFAERALAGIDML